MKISDFFEGDFDVDQLESANVGSMLATPILDYPEIQTMVEYVQDNFEKPPVKINVRKLAIKGKGKAKQDKMEIYLKDKAIPSSGFKEVLKNPANFFFYLHQRDLVFKEDKPYFQLGTFIHMAFLEPKLFKKVKVEPKHSLASIAGAKALCIFYKKINRDRSVQDFESMGLPALKSYLETAKSKCKYMMISEEHKAIISICERNYHLYGGGIIPQIMKGAAVETSFYGVDKHTGIKVKVRPDAINTKENIGVNAVISFKSTSKENVEGFLYDSAKLKYELSEGMYQEVISEVTGEKFNVTIMVMIQTVAPYQPAVLWWSAEDLQNGKYKYRYALDTAKECLDKNQFPGFESLAEAGNYGIINMNQPKFAHKVLEPINLDI